MIDYNKPVFAIKVDAHGRTYFTGYANMETKAVISLFDKNYIVTGNPKINLRKGNSTHGDEIIIEMLQTDTTVTETPKNSTYNNIEIYFPESIGVEFLKEFIKFIEDVKP